MAFLLHLVLLRLVRMCGFQPELLFYLILKLGIIVISVNSVVNRIIPPGSLAGGNPVEVIKEGIYPKKLEKEQKRDSETDSFGLGRFIEA